MRYELAFLIWHFDRGINVERCKQTIPYFCDLKHRKYRPDFIVDGVIYEIKGYMDKFARAKFKVAKALGIKIIVVDRKRMKIYLDYVCLRYRKRRDKIHELYDRKLAREAGIEPTLPSRSPDSKSGMLPVTPLP